ncbi:MAG: acyl-CoA dehydrogenase [Pseudomonadales bacterium]|nr:acyl-CoA dehydrogenase [Pseudomonadales bacterium]
MNFDFSDDQKLLADQVQRFLDENSNPSVVREALDGDTKFSPGVWQGLADMGLLGTAIPEQYGGTGAGYLELCLVAQQVGAHLAAIPFGSTVYLLTEALLQFGSEAQKAQWLPKIATGETRGALAAAESLSQLRASDVATTVHDGLLTGTKIIVSDGNLANLFVVVATENDVVGLYLVETGTGVIARAVDSVDLTRDTAEVQFDAAPCTPLANTDWTALEALQARAAVLYAFEQLGLAQSALNMGVAYAHERFAFGRAIGSFQAIKHMLADMYVAMKLAENNCYYAAWALENDAPDLALAAATARVGSTQASQLCARDNIQVHGGMGFTWEFDCHLYYRRANYMALELGALSEWEEKLVRALPDAA